MVGGRIGRLATSGKKRSRDVRAEVDDEGERVQEAPLIRVVLDADEVEPGAFRSKDLLDDLRIALGVGRHRDSRTTATRAVGRASRREYVATVSRWAHPQTSHADVVARHSAVHRTRVLVEKLVDEVVPNPLPSGRSSAYHGPSTGCRPPRREDRQPASQAIIRACFWHGREPGRSIPAARHPAGRAGIDGE